jgi:hypothetical protein
MAIVYLQRLISVQLTLTHKLGSSIGELVKFTIQKRHQHVGTKEYRMMLLGSK